jgi:hypothetical protein
VDRRGEILQEQAVKKPVDTVDTINGGVSMPKLPTWWKKELEAAGCKVSIERPKKEDNYYGRRKKSDDELPEEVLTASLDKCLIHIRYEPDYHGDPQWQVAWDVEMLMDEGQTKDEPFHVGILSAGHATDETYIPWYSGNECSSLVEVQKSINEWLWCVKTFNKVRKTLLEDMFLKEFRITGCTLDVVPFPTEPHGTYHLATVRYGDTRIEISYDPGSEKWCFDGSVRKCSFKNPEGMIKSLHKRARRFLKGDY